MYGDFLFCLQLACIVVHDDGITYDDADERDDTQHGSDRQVEPKHPQPEHGTKNAQQRDGDREERNADALVVNNQDDEHHHHGSQDGHEQRRHGFLGDGHGAAFFDDNIFGDVECAEVNVDFLVLGQLPAFGHHISHHSDATSTIAMGQVVVLETGMDVGYLAQRHPNTRKRGGHQHVADSLIIDVVQPFGINGGGQVVAVFPHGDHLVA